MIFVFAAVLWVIIIVTLLIIFRDYKKEYSLMKYKVETLEHELEKVIKNEPGRDVVLKINKMASEMLSILQEKEDEIKSIMNLLEDETVKKKKSFSESESMGKIYNYPSDFKEFPGMSESEIHIFQKMRKRRAVNE